MHVFPLTESINFDTVCKALAEIDYSGNFTFEADSTNERFPDELLPYTYRLLEKTGRYLIAKIEAYKEAAKV
jgi:sugar phosphate isomerase/epimerase